MRWESTFPPKTHARWVPRPLSRRPRPCNGSSAPEPSPTTPWLPDHSLSKSCRVVDRVPNPFLRRRDVPLRDRARDDIAGPCTKMRMGQDRTFDAADSDKRDYSTMIERRWLKTEKESPSLSVVQNPPQMELFMLSGDRARSSARVT